VRPSGRTCESNAKATMHGTPTTRIAMGCLSAKTTSGRGTRCRCPLGARRLQANDASVPQCLSRPSHRGRTDAGRRRFRHHAVATGTHQGELMGVRPTDRHADVHGCNVTRFREGKMVQAWVYWDRGHLLEQLGVLPGPKQG